MSSWQPALELATAVLVVAGGFFAFAAALGVLRMKDVYIRMHASTKAGTLGCGLILLAVALHFLQIGTIARALAAIIFLLVTAPVAAHMIGRAVFRIANRLDEEANGAPLASSPPAVAGSEEA